MSRPITQPINQVRLTNVAVVRMNRNGKRFEVACYRNKIVNFRQGIETDLSEVLQTDRVFSNVSKGQFAKSADLVKAFGEYKDEEEICRVILEKGDVQVSDMERGAQLEALTKEVATMVAAKCVDPRSNRPYTPSQILSAMKAAEFTVHPTRSVKHQFLECVKQLKAKQVLPIERAKMELAIVWDAAANDDGDDRSSAAAVRQRLHQQLTAHASLPTLTFTDTNDQPNRIVFQIDPSFYRAVDGATKDLAEGARLEIMRQCVTEEGDVNLDLELTRKKATAEANHQRETVCASLQEDTANRRQEALDSETHADENDAHDDAPTRSSDKTYEAKDDTDQDSDEEDDVAALAQKLMANSRVTGRGKKARAARALQEYGTDDDADDDSDENPPAELEQKSNNAPKTKKSKQPAKKSKKAKRREKEEAEERKARAEAERLRRQERNATQPETTPAVANEAPMQSCNTCGGSFASPLLFRAHFRSDWHLYNIKLKMKGMSPVSEEEFRLCDSDAFFGGAD